MILVHVCGYPLIYAYLFFRRYREPLVILRNQELAASHIDQLAKIRQLSEEDTVKLKAEDCARNPPVDADTLGLPKYVQNLIGGYEIRTYWFEIFEMIRKVLLVGIPGTFDKGGNMQLVWGLLVCFVTAGMYMAYAPFIVDSETSCSSSHSCRSSSHSRRRSACAPCHKSRSWCTHSLPSSLSYRSSALA